MEGEDPPAGEGWVTTKDLELRYDSRVTDLESAKKVYGHKAKFYPAGSSYTSQKGEEVELGLYGFYKVDGVVKLAPDHEQLEYERLLPKDRSGGAIEAGTVLTLALIADDVTGVGVGDDPAIPVVIVGAAATYITLKAAYEIEKILRRPAPGPDGVQYSLRATTVGPYPTVRGGTVNLNVGDIWKFGETIHPDSRYSESWLRASNLKFTP